MILDRLDQSRGYTRLHPAFAEALAFLDRLNPAGLAPGRIEIAGDRLYAMVVQEEGKGRSGTRLESHRNYIDIQYQITGVDEIGWAPAAAVRGLGYDAARDLEFHHGRPLAWSRVPAGHLAIFFPSDAHAPLGGRGHLLKVVVKVRVGA